MRIAFFRLVLTEVTDQSLLMKYPCQMLMPYVVCMVQPIWLKLVLDRLRTSELLIRVCRRKYIVALSTCLHHIARLSYKIIAERPSKLHH